MNILIIEDEQKTAKLLKEMISDYDSSYLIVATCESVAESVTFLSKHQGQLDLIFMDIQLTDGISFEIFQKIDLQTPVVFCTAYDQYSLDAFKNNGIDYILKPFKDEDLAHAFEKIKRLKDKFTLNLREILKNINLEKESLSSSIIVKFRDKIYPINIDDIACLFIENEITYVYDFAEKRHPLFRPINELYDLLPENRFFRVNRQVIVNKKAIKEIVPYFHRKMIIKLSISTNEKIVLGKTKITQFITWLEK